MIASSLSTGTHLPVNSVKLGTILDMKQPNIVFIGHVVIDHNKVEQTSYTSWGSPAMFMTKYFQAHFGLEPVIIASYGPDFKPYLDGITLLPPSPNLAQSIVYENIVRNGHRTQYCHHGEAPLPRITPEIQAALQQADILFLVPLVPTMYSHYVKEIMENVSSNCLKILSPQGYLRHINSDGLVQPREFTEVTAVLPYFNVVILSDEDHPKADIKAREWKSTSPNTEIIITLNSQGADIIQPHDIKRVPTTPVPLSHIVDSTGLGDLFSAAVGLNLYYGKDITAAVNAAHAATRERLLHATSATA